MGPIEFIALLAALSTGAWVLARRRALHPQPVDVALHEAQQLFRTALSGHPGRWQHIYVSQWTLEGIALDTENSRLAFLQGDGGRAYAEIFRSDRVLGSEVHANGVPIESTTPGAVRGPLGAFSRLSELTLVVRVDDLSTPERHVAFLAAPGSGVRLAAAMDLTQHYGSPIEWHQRLIVLIERGRQTRASRIVSP